MTPTTVGSTYRLKSVVLTTSKRPKMIRINAAPIEANMVNLQIGP